MTDTDIETDDATTGPPPGGAEEEPIRRPATTGHSFEPARTEGAE